MPQGEPQGDCQAETDAHRAALARGNVGCHLRHPYQALGHVAARHASGGHLIDEIVARLRHAAKEDLVLLGGQVLAGIVGQCTVFAQRAPGCSRVWMAQERGYVGAAVSDEVDVPLHPQGIGRGKAGLFVVGERAAHRCQVAQGDGGSFVSGIPDPRAAVVLNDAHVLRGEDAGRRVHEVGLGVVQPAHRRPLLLQQIVVLANVDRDAG